MPRFKAHHFLYTIGKALVALAWLVAVSLKGPALSLPMLALLLAISLFSTLTAIRFGMVGLAFTSVVYLTAFLIGGLPLAGWTAFINSLLIEGIVAAKPSLLQWVEWMEPLPLRYAFLLRGMDNAGTSTITVLAAGLTYQALGGRLPFDLSAQVIGPYLILCPVHFLVDFFWHSIYLLLRGASPIAFLKENLLDFLMLQLAPLPFAALTAAIYLKLGSILFVLFILGVGGVSLIAKEMYQARNRLEQRVRELTVINRIGQALASYLDVKAILNVLREQAASLLGEESIYLALYDEETGEITFPLVVEKGELRQWRSRKPAQGLTEYVFRTARPLCLNGDVAAEAARRGIKPMGPIPRAWLGVPLIAGEKVIGVLAVEAHGGRIWVDDAPGGGSAFCFALPVE